ncbi:MAG: UDP-N-acetylglucosamine 2-epimerase (non-hydrolyzing) [Thermoplasmata archaeon]|nr:UDP-N-acetylglucosamine 2-epimerase (non-hydrolyzing) [Thermoplasmata archaeon]
MKLVIAFGTKPCTIKMAPLVKEAEARGHETYILYSGQHWSPNLYSELFDDLELRYPDFNLRCGEESYSLTQLATNIMMRTEHVLNEVKPDIVFTHGDTTTSLAVSLSANLSLTPVGHVEAGLRTFSKEPYPEQLNTRVSDAASDVHFAPVEKNARNLRNEGFPEERIFTVGNTVIDIAKWASERDVDVLKKYDLKKPLVYFSIHRRETTMDRERFSGPVRAILEMTEYNYFVSMRPGTRAALERYGYLKDLEAADHILLVDSIPSYVETMNIIKHCSVILTDSGSMLEEGAGLHIPCLTARFVTDRPETVTTGSNMIVGLKKQSVIDGLRKVMEDAEFRQKMMSAPSPYGEGDASKKILDITESLHDSGELLQFEKEITTRNV